MKTWDSTATDDEAGALRQIRSLGQKQPMWWACISTRRKMPCSCPSNEEPQIKLYNALRVTFDCRTGKLLTASAIATSATTTLFAALDVSTGEVNWP